MKMPPISPGKTLAKATLIVAASAFAIFGASAVLQPTTSEAGVDVHIGIGQLGQHWGGHRYGYRQRCYVTNERVWVSRGYSKNKRRGGGHWAWQRVRVCR